jgi:transketolase
MDEARRTALERVALEVRKDVVRMAGVAGAHGLDAALSAVDLIVYLYWERMNIFPEERNRPTRDRLVLSSGSASPALYACLARLGFFERDELWSYRRLGGMLQGYPDIRTPGVDAPGGTSGLGIALGLCLALRMDGAGGRVFCMMEAGELSGGSAWESIFAAPSIAADNLLLVVDSGAAKDPFQGLDSASLIAGKLSSLGWAAYDADGHDFFSLDCAFCEAESSKGMPRAVIAATSSYGGYQADAESGRAGKPLSIDDVERTLSRLESEAHNMEESR